MRGGVHQPGGMKSNHSAEEDAPQNVLPSAGDQEADPEHGDRHPVPAADPYVELIFAKFRNIRQKIRRIVVHRLTRQDPSHVRPETAVARRVRVSLFVRVLVMHSMGCNPEYRTALQGQSAAYGEEVLDPFGRFITAVRQQPVVAHADTQASGNPPQQHREQERLPAEEEKCRDGTDVPP
jgi:hypothetical protein